MMLCRRVQPLPIEVIVRGYLAGSGWKDYGRTGAVCGIPLPAGCARATGCRSRSSRRRRRPRQGHDENISIDEAADARRARASPSGSRELAIALYRRGAEIAEPAGIILADTKFEFGIDPATGELILIDEVLTPDSSRFWDAADYEPGRAQASFDKQYVRDWLETQDWDKTPPGPGAAGGGRRRDARPLRRGVRADHRRQLRALSRRGRDRRVTHDAWTSGSPSTSCRSPGSSIRRAGRSRAASATSGSTACSDVRVGRRVELTVDGGRRGGGAGDRRAARRGAAVEPADRGVRRRGARGASSLAGPGRPA